jgi:plasmid stability protein
MASILVRDLDQRAIQRLKKRARLAKRSLQEEVKEILERAAETLTMSEARRSSDAAAALLGGRFRTARH